MSGHVSVVTYARLGNMSNQFAQVRAHRIRLSVVKFRMLFVSPMHYLVGHPIFHSQHNLRHGATGCSQQLFVRYDSAGFDLCLRQVRLRPLSPVPARDRVGEHTLCCSLPGVGVGCARVLHSTGPDRVVGLRSITAAFGSEIAARFGCAFEFRDGCRC